ncbi:MAG: tyrosine-type recombinase/integrase [Bacteroidota bacterium]
MSVLNTESVQPFLEYLKYEKRYSVHTFTSYQNDLTDFISFLDTAFGGVALADINHSFVRSWLAGLKDRGLSAKTINRKISSLKSFFKYCLKTGAVEATPMAKVISPKTGKQLPSFMREEEAERLIYTFNQSADDWKSLNAKMIISILYSTGMRLSELLNLREKQIDFDKGQFKVLGKGNKERIIPVSNQLLNLIRRYQQQKAEKFASKDSFGEKTDDLLLITEKGKKIYPRYAWLLVNTYLGMASTLGKKSPHVLRHSFATHLVNNGAGLNAVKELLGHSSLAATQVYTHNSIGQLKNIHKKAHPKA